MATLKFGPVGAIYRGNIRRAAFSLDLKIEEQKGLLDSMFRLTGTDRNILLMKQYLDDLGRKMKEMDAEDARQKALRKAAKRWWKPSTWLD